MTAKNNEPMIMALPKGRILKEVMPIIRGAGIEPEADLITQYHVS